MDIFDEIEAESKGQTSDIFDDIDETTVANTPVAAPIEKPVEVPKSLGQRAYDFSTSLYGGGLRGWNRGAKYADLMTTGIAHTIAGGLGRTDIQDKLGEEALKIQEESQDRENKINSKIVNKTVGDIGDFFLSPEGIATNMIGGSATKLGAKGVKAATKYGANLLEKKGGNLATKILPLSNKLTTAANGSLVMAGGMAGSGYGSIPMNIAAGVLNTPRMIKYAGQSVEGLGALGNAIANVPMGAIRGTLADLATRSALIGGGRYGLGKARDAATEAIHKAQNGGEEETPKGQIYGRAELSTPQ
jgi:hypothetical protein